MQSLINTLKYPFPRLAQIMALALAPRIDIHGLGPLLAVYIKISVVDDAAVFRHMMDLLALHLFLCVRVTKWRVLAAADAPAHCPLANEDLFRRILSEPVFLDRTDNSEGIDNAMQAHCIEDIVQCNGASIAGEQVRLEGLLVRLRCVVLVVVVEVRLDVYPACVTDHDYIFYSYNKYFCHSLCIFASASFQA